MLGRLHTNHDSGVVMTKLELDMFTEMVSDLEDRLEWELKDYSLGDEYGRHQVAMSLAKWATLRIQEVRSAAAEHAKIAIAAREDKP